MESFDLVVVGGGPAGYVGAIRGTQLGLRTALVERDKVGGTCLHVGCIPTKVLLHTAQLLEDMRGASEFGIAVDGARLDMAQLHRRRERVVTTNFRGVEYLMRKNGITVLAGSGRLLDATHVRVTGSDGSTTDAQAGAILLATGSTPRSLPGVTIDNARVLDSTGALRLEEVPGSIAIIGAGAVGSEFASVFAAFGAKVTLIEYLPSCLPLEDEEVAAVLTKALERRGVTVKTGAAVTGVRPEAGGVRISLRAAPGPGPDRGDAEETVAADYALVAVGRAPLVDGLGLEAVGLAVEGGALPVDARMRTSVETIYAAGDMIGGLLLAHVGSAEATVAVEAIAGHNPAPLDPLLMPRATYSIPQVASVGLTERQAKEAGRDVAVGRFQFMANARAAILNHREGLVKIVADRELGEILGVHLAGPEVTELLPEVVLGKSLEATVLEIGQAVHAHPTLSEAVHEAALAALGRAIHG
ncbi:MAG TPA: dihydrolipoyl dehydrogenase [bacterium]|nr:dihydrolipoyl dehydrogenase [bacterium]